jgi:hypothetical protein
MEIAKLLISSPGDAATIVATSRKAIEAARVQERVFLGFAACSERASVEGLRAPPSSPLSEDSAAGHDVKV